MTNQTDAQPTPPGAGGPGPSPVPGIVPLSLRERARGKRYYRLYSVFNSISYPVLAEGVVTLVLLRLGGTETWVGVTAGLLYVTLPFMLLGYRTIPRLGVGGTAAWFWVLRSLSAAFMIAAPWAAQVLGGSWGLWCMFIGSLGFNVGRSAGVVSFTGIVTELTTDQDRGDLISASMRISQGGTLLVTVLMALLLGPHAHGYFYQMFFAVGLVSGLAAAWSLWRIPESGQFRSAPPFRLAEQLRWLMESQGRRWFLAMMVVVPVTQGIARTFLLLVAKQGYGLHDQVVLAYVIVGTLGGIVSSYAYGLFLDKLGSRPLLVLTGFIDTASVAVIVALPARPQPLLLGLAFLLTGFANIAYQAAMQHYFISITGRRHQLPLAIITQGLGGVAAGLALSAGGWSLELLNRTLTAGGDPLLRFRWFFAGLLLVMAVRTLILFRLPRLHSQRVRSALNALISPYDWRAAFAVRRAMLLQSEDEESRALRAMLQATPAIYADDLRHYLSSPSYVVRQQAMEALAGVQPSPPLIQALLEDVRANRFLTAHLAAQWLGRWQVREAIPLLRDVVYSRDFLLCSKAIHALVELGDRDSYPLIEVRFAASDNPLEIIEGARALSLWGGPAAYPLLLEKYRRDIAVQAKDEVSLAIARLLGVYDGLYRDLALLHRDPLQLNTEWQERLVWRGQRRGPAARGRAPGPITGAPEERTSPAAILGLEKEVLAVLSGGDQPSAPFERALRALEPRLQPWFHADTLAAVRTIPGTLDGSLAVLLAFLLITPEGEHWQVP